MPPRSPMDEAAHLGVPAARLVAEMNAGLQQLRDAYVGHGLLPCLYAIGVRADGADPERERCRRSGQGRDPLPARVEVTS